MSDQLFPRPQAPAALKVIAWLFLIGGVLAIHDVITGLLRHKININFAVMGVFIGPGLLRFQKRWWTWGYVLTCIGLVGAALFFIVSWFQPVTYNYFGTKWQAGTIFPGVMLSAALFAFIYWQYTVLDSAEIRRLFEPGPNQVHTFIS